jgi:hypothetical protein
VGANFVFRDRIVTIPRGTIVPEEMAIWDKPSWFGRPAKDV